MKKLAPFWLAIALMVAAVAWWASRPPGSAQAEREALAPQVEQPAPLAALQVPLVEAPRQRSDPLAKPQPGAALESPQPGLGVPELGLYGFVHSRDGSPIEGAQVSIEIGSAWIAPQRVRAKTNALGYWAVEWNMQEIARSAYRGRQSHKKLLAEQQELLAISKLNAQLEILGYTEEAAEVVKHVLPVVTATADEVWAQPLELSVRASAAKSLSGLRTLPISSSVSGLMRIDLVLEKRFEFSGEAISGGMGVPAADVLLFDQDWSFIEATRSDLEGGFCFSPPEPGRFRVHARRENVGAGATGGFHLGGPFITPNIVVPVDDGMLLLRGKLIFSNGEPVPGVEVMAIEVGLSAANPMDDTRPGLSALAQAEAAGGLALSHGRTDLDGMFYMAAMQPGEYLIRVDGLDDENQPEDPIPAGAENRVRVEGQLLDVEVVTHRAALPFGLRVKLVEQTNREFVSEASAQQSKRPNRRRNSASSSRREYRELQPGETQRALSRSAVPAPTSFLLEPGTTWEVWAGNGAVETRHEFVTIKVSRRTQKVTLELPWNFDASGDRASTPSKLGRMRRPPEPGQLRVDLLDEDGKLRACKLSLWKRDHKGKLIIALEELHLEPGKFTPLVPAGDYVLSLRAVDSEGELAPPGTGAKTLKLGSGERKHIKPDEAQHYATPRPESDVAADAAASDS